MISSCCRLASVQRPRGCSRLRLTVLTSACFVSSPTRRDACAESATGAPPNQWNKALAAFSRRPRYASPYPRPSPSQPARRR
eukprot:6439195-Alexandrium_andersonii.AAC.1